MSERTQEKDDFAKIREQVSILKGMYHHKERRGIELGELRTAFQSLSSILALADPATLEFVATNTEFIKLIHEIIYENAHPEFVSDVLRLLGDMTDPEAYEGEDRSNALIFIGQAMDLDLFISLSVLLLKNDGLYTLNCLEIFDNLCEIFPSAGPEHLIQKTSLVNDLLSLITQKPNELELDVPLAASELLSIIVHGSDLAKLALSEKPQMEKLLQAVAIWKKRDPEYPEEQEWCENVHSTLRTLLISSNSARRVFLDLEGIELAIRLLKSGSLCQALAVKLLKSCSGYFDEACQRIVAAGGLKYVFPVFMGQTGQARKRLKTTGDSESTIDESGRDALGVISMLALTSIGTDWARLRQKFMEPGKTERLIEFHLHALAQVNAKVEEMEEDAAEEEQRDELDEYLELLLNGLDLLQEADLVIARLMRDPESSSTMRTALLSSCDQDETELGLVLERVKQVMADFASYFELPPSIDGAAAEDTKDKVLEKFQSKLIDFALF